jgi:glycosyltransferase involved in cell wall biosynthesis
MPNPAIAHHAPVRSGGHLFPYGLSVFFPAYNDAPSLPDLINKTFQVLEEHVRDFEVIVVNDGSADNTGEVLAELAKLHGRGMSVLKQTEKTG